MSKYKNVYTILEKVKKGQIDSYYKDRDGLFGKLNFYKKPDLIKPYIHYIDQDKIDEIVEQYIVNNQNIQKEFNHFIQSNQGKKAQNAQKFDLSAFCDKVRENYENMPESLKYDVFKLFYNKMDKLEFEERTDTNKVRYKFLEHANNPVAKIMTEGSNLKSAIYARNMMMYYLMRLTEMDYVDPNTSEDIKKGLNGSNEFDDQDNNLQKMFDDSGSKDMMERMMQEAQDMCKKLDDALDQETQEELFDQAEERDSSGNSMASKLDTDFIQKVTAEISNMRLNMGSLKDKIKKLLDKSISYFSSKKTTTEEDLFNSDNIAGLEDFVLLHPKLRKIFAEDLTVKDSKSIGKIDIYIDISGSMNEDCGIKDLKGNDLTKIQFAKSITAKMKELDLLNEVYLFDTKVKKYKSDLISISMIGGSGGTNLSTVVNSINTRESNAIVLTDAEDWCNVYSEKAFFIGVKGSRFVQFTTEVREKYVDNGQLIIFDGQRTYNVDKEGKPIK
jgi:hypothetical protein